MYISITGLQLRSNRHQIKFWWHAIRSIAQARRAAGNISTDARIIDGVHHTLTVWDNEVSMRRYLFAGAHLKAMKAFGSIATGKTLGYTSVSIPGWDEVHSKWLLNGKPVGQRPRPSGPAAAEEAIIQPDPAT